MWHLDFPQFGQLDAAAYERERVALLAREIRSVCGQEQQEMFDPFAAARSVGIEVRVRKLIRGAEGLIRFDASAPTIDISDSFPSVRQRFTLCHELAHLTFVKIKPRFFNKDRRGDHAAVHIREERLCNLIAGELLMPRERFVRKARSMLPEFFSVSQLATHYGVSIAAVIRQLELSHVWSIGRAAWEIRGDSCSRPELKRMVRRSKLGKENGRLLREAMLRAFDAAADRLQCDRRSIRAMSDRLDAGRYVLVDTLDFGVLAVRLSSKPYRVGGTVFQ